MWLPIDQHMGELIENGFQVKGGHFVFNKDGCGPNFEGFNGVVEVVWKAKFFHHQKLLSFSPSSSSHTRLGISCELPKKDIKSSSKNSGRIL